MNRPCRVAIVTGAGRGIGRAIARRLAAEGLDMVVAGPDMDELAATVDDVEAVGQRGLAARLDVSNESSVEAMAAEVRREFGRIDVLVNNAAIIGPTAPAHEIERRDWDEVLAVNLTGAFLCARAVLPDMIERQSGRIINIASIAGKMAYALRSPYAVSKWGLIGLTLTLAKEAGPYDIQVNAVCPGPVAGRRMASVFERRALQTERSIEDVRQDYLDQTLLGRLVEEDEVASLVAYLASDAAKNITGQSFDVTAGYGL